MSCDTMFSHCLHKFTTQIAITLYTQFAIYQQLVSIKFKFHLSRSQELSKCLILKKWLKKGTGLCSLNRRTFPFCSFCFSTKCWSSKLELPFHRNIPSNLWKMKNLCFFSFDEIYFLTFLGSSLERMCCIVMQIMWSEGG